MKQQTYILENSREVLLFLKSRFPLFHQSNFFFRDVQFGIQALLDRKGMKVGYAQAESIARAFVAALEKENVFLPIDRQSWTVNLPEFRKPVVKAAPKPAVASPSRPPAAPAAAPATPSPAPAPAAAGPTSP